MKTAVIIPCYRVRDNILDVLEKIGDEVTRIYCVDDGCPDGSGNFILDRFESERLVVLFNVTNQGVGSAVKMGYKAALADGMEILIKVDGDGQMDPIHIPNLVRSIEMGLADYCKANRFFNQKSFEGMPASRLFGNAVLSFLTKITTGYWNIVDPANGYTAAHSSVLKELNFDALSEDFFFESSMLFNLGLVGAVVHDVPIKAVYGEEESNLLIRKIIIPFLRNHWFNLCKRIYVVHFLRGFSIASLELVLGLILLAFGTIYGGIMFFDDYGEKLSAAAGPVMLAALPILLGTQFLLSFLRHDYSIQPSIPIHLSLQNFRSD